MMSAIFDGPPRSRTSRALLPMLGALLLMPVAHDLPAQGTSGSSQPATVPVLIDIPWPPAQDTAKGQAATRCSGATLPPAQLEALVAPIPLYPDPLLAQTLVASTYPLEVIQLQRIGGRERGSGREADRDTGKSAPPAPNCAGGSVAPGGGLDLGGVKTRGRLSNRHRDRRQAGTTRMFPVPGGRAQLA